jgi:hypothetical protein
MATEPERFDREAAQAAGRAREFGARTEKDERRARTAFEDELADSRENEPPTAWFQTLLKESPYLFMLVMAIIGVAYTSFTGRSLNLYWQTLIPVYGIICVHAGWRRFDDPEARLGLIWTQVLHWLAFLVAMNIIYSPDVRDIENNNAAGLNLMILLALGTFVAGVHVRAWQICAVGCLLALSVPAMAWVEQSALFLLLAFAFAVFVVASLWWTLRSQRRKSSKSPASLAGSKIANP